MFTLASTLFLAGLLTILLPCILPLIPIVLGVSIADRNPWRPLLTIIGMLVSFVGSVFLLQVVLSEFVEIADYIRIGSYYLLLLFGLGFLFHRKVIQIAGAVLGSLFFLEKGWLAVAITLVLGVLAMELGGRVASSIQQIGSDVQTKARTGFGANSNVTALIIGLTMGLVWVPCAGPALSFALTLVRNQPGFLAFLYLSCYGIGAGLPLLLIGYGGQTAVKSARALTKYSGLVKQVSGALLIFSAIALQYNWFLVIQTALTDLGFGSNQVAIEERLLGEGTQTSGSGSVSSKSSSSKSSSVVSQKVTTSSSAGAKTDMKPVASSLPVIGAAPEAFVGLGPWHNSKPLVLADLRGKVVLVDFWTYSCINCIRTLPYIEAIAEKYTDQPFVVVGVHTPEFTFEKSQSNVAQAIKRHGLTYPIAQDNNFSTWNAFHNQYWPAKYLIDAKGNIRYTHFGEGEYDETDDAVASLLAEIGYKGSTKALPPEVQSGGKETTPETYLHSRSWDALGNAKGPPTDDVLTYALPATMKLNEYYLGGTWQLVEDERMVLMSDTGEIGIRALGGEVNLVLGVENGGKAVQADIMVDGKKTKTITIDGHDLYNLFTGTYGEHDIVLKIRGKNVAGFAFTFGA